MAERLVRVCTSETLLAPDWQSTTELSDMINARTDSARAVAHELATRLASSNPKVVTLALTLADSLLKNATAPAVAALSSRETAAALGHLVEGRGPRDTQARASALLQDLGLAFAFPPALTELPWASMYNAARARGFRFAPVGDPAAVARQFSALSVGAPAPTPGARRQPAAAAPAPAAPAAPREPLPVALARVREELRVVRARVADAARDLVAGAAAPTATGFLDAVDFLEQCTPRLRDLIEACVSGAIADEAFFELCLGVNEAVARLLDAARPVAGAQPSPAFVPKPFPELADLAAVPPPGDGGPAGAGGDGAAGSGGKAAPAPPRASGGVHDDLLGLFDGGAAAAAAAAPAAVPARIAAPTAAGHAPSVSAPPAAVPVAADVPLQAAAPPATSPPPAPAFNPFDGPAPAVAATALSHGSGDAAVAFEPTAVRSAGAARAAAGSGSAAPALPASGAPTASAAAVLADFDALLGAP